MPSSRTLSFILILSASIVPLGAQARAEVASDAELCRWQLEYLISRDKLMDEEAAIYKAQCDCLGSNGQHEGQEAQNACAQQSAY